MGRLDDQIRKKQKELDPSVQIHNEIFKFQENVTAKVNYERRIERLTVRTENRYVFN
jgi:hypothetical protein